MFMGIGNYRPRDELSGRVMRMPRPVPDDFEVMFVKIGRTACQEHYSVGRQRVNEWLEECGKDRLVELRAQQCGPLSKNWKGDRPGKLSRRDMGKILSAAFPVSVPTELDPMLVEQAAQFMRMVRNGGWPVSRSTDGYWNVGISRKTADELVEIARRKGFTPNLTGGK